MTVISLDLYRFPYRHVVQIYHFMVSYLKIPHGYWIHDNDGKITRQGSMAYLNNI